MVIALDFKHSFIYSNGIYVWQDMPSKDEETCRIWLKISPANPLTNYKLIDDIILELSKRLKVQTLQEALAEAWKPYSFSQKGRSRETTSSVIMAKKEPASVRASAMEGPFGMQKEHYGLKRRNSQIVF